MLIVLAGLALAVAFFEALQPSFPVSDRAAGMALGLLAGAGLSLKTQLIPLAVVLLTGWILSAPGRRAKATRTLYGIPMMLVTGAPGYVLRWIDTATIFPAYNNIFKSRYWLPVNEKLDFPWDPHPGLLGPLKAIWRSIVDPSLMGQALPPGAFGAFTGIVLVAVLIGWRWRRRTPGALVLWTALVISVVAWWVEFRYLRYLLPVAIASVVLLLAAARRPAITGSVRVPVALAIGLATGASFAVSVAMFWNVPNRKLPISAADGHWKETDYLNAALAERFAFLKFDQISPPNSVMFTDAFERIWLTRGRDLYAPGRSPPNSKSTVHRSGRATARLRG